jgi:hypothetical protein
MTVVKGGSLGGSIRVPGVRLTKGSINKNRRGGPETVWANRVFQIVQCRENTSPFTGGPNTAGEAEAQCF